MRASASRLSSRIASAFVTTLLLTVLVPTAALAVTPTDQLRQFFATVSQTLTTAEDREIEDVLKEVVSLARPLVAFPEAAELALGAQWANRTPAERSEFVRLFADLLERAFVLRLAGAARARRGVDLDYHGEVISGALASVHAAAEGKDGNDIPLEFRMLKHGDGWKVVDVAIHGVSIVSNYHAQFTRIARDGSYTELVARLRDKTSATASAAPAVTPRPVLAATADTWAPVVDANGAVTAERAVPVEVRPTQRSPDARRSDAPAAIAPRAGQEHVAQTAVTSQRPSQKLVVSTSMTSPRGGQEPPRSATSPVALPTAPARVEQSVVPLQGAPTSALAPVAAGTGPIVQTALAKPVRGVEPTATKASRYWVQVGAFKDAAAAGRVAERLLVDHLPVGIAPGASLTRVRVGPFADRVEAVSNLRTLELKGYRAFIAEDR